MPKLPSFRRLRKEDYEQEDQSLVEKLSVSLNYGIEALYDALNNKVSFTNNIASAVKDVQMSVTASGVPTEPISFSLASSTRAIGLLVVNVQNLNNSAGYPTGGVTPSWSQSNATININHITGLQTNQLYNIRFIAILE